MDDLRELYQQLILEHDKRPRNFGKLEHATAVRHGTNPRCGDNVQVYLTVEHDTIQDIKFEATGCAISKASASIMTTLVKGKSRAEARSIFQQFHELATTDSDQSIDLENLGALAAFAGVHQFPARVKCATLPWHTMHAALEGDALTISTE